MPQIAPIVWVAIGSLAVAAGAAVMEHNAANRAARDQKNAQATSLAEQQAQVAAQKKAQVRQERIRKAEILSGAINSGSDMSSGQINSTSDIGSLVGGNIGQMARNENSANAVLNFDQQAADSMSTARTYGSISSLAGGVSSFALQQPSAQRSLANIFG